MTAQAEPPAPRPVLRRCACEPDETHLRRFATSTGPAHAPQAVHDVLGTPGVPLDSGARAALEPRFGRDFSQVRVHADAASGASAQAVGARAYTVGQDIVFAAGRYAPGTAEGRRLLAHELTHVVQQSAAGPAVATSPLTVGAANDPAEHEAERVADRVTAGHSAAFTAAPAARVIRRQATGTSVIVDTIAPGGLTSHGFVFDARVDRTQYRNQTDADRARANPAANVPIMDTGHVRVRYDALNHRLTLPLQVAVRGATPADITAAGKLVSPGQTAPATVDPTLVERVATEYITACNSALNGWYEVVLEGGTGLCAGPPIPIVAEVTRVTGGTPDYTIVVSNLRGRSSVSPGAGRVLLLSGSTDRLTFAHEATHMVLGHPDEYREDDAQLRRDFPLQKGDERVRTDWSLSASQFDVGNWFLLHERHFSFVPVFLHAVFTQLGQPQCNPVLRPVRRPVLPEFRISLGTGYASYGGGAVSVSGGLDLGLELNRTREWQFFLGAHATLLSALDYRSASAFLAGARFGLGYRYRPADQGFQLGGYGELGAATEFGARTNRPAAPFVGGGLRAGYHTPRFGGGTAIDVGLDVGAGTRLEADPVRWYRIGLEAGVSF
ncbi:DUF4157 domain-containing protein [Kitasatospora aureofaciens]|uniref:eCIS core domain-containing protein n=1 Tax=Kitasatospora aureofaciens TaxID=1894 RepID=UPI00210DC9F5|nr:DUF4157 domain-containing protein [Kitasatospora aureofaciens]